MKTWTQVALLVAVAVVVTLLLGPLVGEVELGIIAVLTVSGIVLIVRRSRKRDAPAPR